MMRVVTIAVIILLVEVDAGGSSIRAAVARKLRQPEIP